MAKKKKVIPEYVICLWKWTPIGMPSERWKLEESYGVDMDGYAVTLSKHAVKGRESWFVWMYKKDGVEADDWEIKDGVAVTQWSFDGGARLVDLGPPSRNDAWVTHHIVDIAKETLDWYKLFTGGYEMKFQTSEAAKKMFCKKV